MRVCFNGITYGFVIVLLAGAIGSAVTFLGGSATMATTIAAALLLVLRAVRTPDKAATTAVSTAMSLGWAYAFASKFALWLPLATMRFYGVQFESYPFNLIIITFVATVLAYPAAFVVRWARRAMLPVAIAFAVATTVFAALGLRSFTRPQPDDYGKLFTTARINPGGETRAGAVTVRYDFAPATADTDRHCVATANGVEIAGPPGRAMPLSLDCSPLTVRSDARADAVLVFGSDQERPIGMFKMNGDNLEEIGLADLQGRLGAPRGWVFGALGSIIAACVAIAMALRARRPIAGAEGQHEGGGWIRVEGVPRFAAELVSQGPGPVVVLGEPRSGPTYRDDGAAKIFTAIPGTLATMREEQRARVATWACVAFASSVIGLVPLWLAHVHGLL